MMRPAPVAVRGLLMYKAGCGVTWVGTSAEAEEAEVNGRIHVPAAPTWEQCAWLMLRSRTVCSQPCAWEQQPESDGQVDQAQTLWPL
eukprot:CAMPEP_0195101126 /NCGR_PEP_ID=MMETSP0448-20130528/64928_1 /TAXON_ID=66468 /ORGANISM="Heterocapsa triquestra, Strain CCMP 448" /LENGTH=86 /DNA_ID=CAMNT_0040136381 /DNA_START=203 /DNA_END=459 /DNA_ORIENTATION=+